MFSQDCKWTKLIDFGLAVELAHPMRDWTGTKQFKGPQKFAKQPYDGVKDELWAIAFILFCLRSGRPPFTAANILPNSIPD